MNWLVRGMALAIAATPMFGGGAAAWAALPDGVVPPPAASAVEPGGDGPTSESAPALGEAAGPSPDLAAALGPIAAAGVVLLPNLLRGDPLAFGPHAWLAPAAAAAGHVYAGDPRRGLNWAIGGYGLAGLGAYAWTTHPWEPVPGSWATGPQSLGLKVGLGFLTGVALAGYGLFLTHDAASTARATRAARAADE